MLDIDLDDVAALRAGDQQEMLNHVAALAGQCRGAWATTQDLELPSSYQSIDHVLIAGMGGSAIGGDLAASVAADHSPIPIVVQRDYELPAWAGKRTLLIASSYSGNTEETLAAFQTARRQGCRLVALATAGDLARLAVEWDVPFVSFQYKSMPRAALGYLFVSLLGILRAVGIVRDLESDLWGALGLLERLGAGLAPNSPKAANQAKQLAAALWGHVPVVTAAEALAPVARRWKTQFNENSKGWAFFEVLPEMDHNALSGLHYPAEAASLFRVLFLRQAGLHPRNLLRLDATQEILESQGIACHRVSIPGESKLAQILSAVNLGDYVSCYLALLYGTDPTAIEDIHGLKRQMSGRV